MSLGLCEKHSMQTRYATPEFIAQYVHYLRTRPHQGQSNIVRIDSQASFPGPSLPLSWLASSQGRL